MAKLCNRSMRNLSSAGWQATSLSINFQTDNHILQYNPH